MIKLLSRSGTRQSVATTLLAPAIWKACRSPATPSPLRTVPTPVSQALSTTRSVPERSSPTISAPVRMPSSPAVPEPRFAPASASPQRRSGSSSGIPSVVTACPRPRFPGGGAAGPPSPTILTL